MEKIILYEDFEAENSLKKWSILKKGEVGKVTLTRTRILDGSASCLLTTSNQRDTMVGISYSSPLILKAMGVEFDFQLGDEGSIAFEIAPELQTGKEMHQASIRWVQDESFQEGVLQYWNGSWQNAKVMPIKRGPNTKHHLKLFVDHSKGTYGYITCDDVMINLKDINFKKVESKKVPKSWISIMLYNQSTTPVTSVLDNILFTKR